jgi:glutathione-regulated potassium-efflux system ancillary protein KefF
VTQADSAVMQKQLYYLFAHPDRRRSQANRTIFEHVRTLENVTAVDLYESYPGFHIDVEREQKRLQAHDVIVIQHPIYWYSVPPLLKLWMDVVLQLGFAYGPGGTALTGKTLQLSLTTGGGADAYSDEGLHGYPLEAFLLPWVQTARLCKMEWLPPLVLHGAGRASALELQAHAEHVRGHVVSLVNPAFVREGG